MEHCTCSLIIAICFAFGKEEGEVVEHIRLHLILSHQFLSDIIVFVHLPNEVQCFDLIRDDDIDGPAFFKDLSIVGRT